MKRKLKHSKYFTIPAFMILAKKTDKDCSELLGISTRTFKDKIKGYSDFTAEQGRQLSEFLEVTQEQLFLTQNVSIRHERGVGKHIIKLEGER